MELANAKLEVSTGKSTLDLDFVVKLRHTRLYAVLYIF